jgi:hypothetical protein
VLVVQFVLPSDKDEEDLLGVCVGTMRVNARGISPAALIVFNAIIDDGFTVSVQREETLPHASPIVTDKDYARSMNECGRHLFDEFARKCGLGAN